MIVVDMDIPESCQDCRAYGTSACDKWDKHRTFSDQRTKRHKDCPIVGEIEQEPKTGHWIEKEGREQGYDIAGIKIWYMQIMCDKCGFIKTAIEGHTGQYHFCPNCVAKMADEEKEEWER